MAQFGFPKSDRIRKRKDFIALKNSGKAIHHQDFIAVLGDGLQPNRRLGITVTKRIGTAVVRNTIKRIVRDHFRLHKQTLPGTLDIHIIAKSSAAKRHTTELRHALHQLFADVARRYRH